MSQDFVEKVIGRMLTDDNFRTRACIDLPLVCQKEGYVLNPDEIRMVLQTDFGRLSAAAEALDGGIRRFGLKNGT
ncbi:MAG: Os1348 family NHLP clan protein [Desulfuromonadaceae bacterium]